MNNQFVCDANFWSCQIYLPRVGWPWSIFCRAVNWLYRKAVLRNWWETRFLSWYPIVNFPSRIELTWGLQWNCYGWWTHGPHDGNWIVGSRWVGSGLCQIYLPQVGWPWNIFCGAVNWLYLGGIVVGGNAILDPMKRLRDKYYYQLLFFFAPKNCSFLVK